MVVQIADRATFLWHAMNELYPLKSERAELRSAGVSETSIAALYPAAFQSLLPNLRAMIRFYDIERLPDRGQRDGIGYDGWLLRIQLPEQLHAQAELDELAFNRASGDDSLRMHLFGVLPISKRGRSSEMAFNLWQAHWLMDHVAHHAEPKAVHEYFCTVVDWVLPQLSARVK